MNLPIIINQLIIIHPRLDYHAKSSLREDIQQRRRHRSSSSSYSSTSISLGSHKRSKKSKRSKHVHKKRRRRSMSPSSSSQSTQSENDFSRYKRVKITPQVAETPLPIQPAEPIHITPVNISPVNIAQNVTESIPQTTKDSGSDSEAEIWSFDRAINEVFRLLPQELCPKNSA